MTATDVQHEGDITAHPKGLGLRKFKDSAFIVWGIIATIIGLGTLVTLVADLFGDGGHRLTAAFFGSFPCLSGRRTNSLPRFGGVFLSLPTLRPTARSAAFPVRSCLFSGHTGISLDEISRCRSWQ